MDEHDLVHTDDNSLASLMDLGQQTGQLWSAQELGAVLRHQLAAPLEFDLGATGDAAMAERLASYANLRPPIQSFGDLVFHPRPPLELLGLVKEFSKSCRAGKESVLPDEIATTLYALGIAAAMTACDRRITRLDDQALAHLIDWVREQEWLDAASRELLEAARTLLTENKNANGHE